jgi:hypothetical protein
MQIGTVSGLAITVGWLIAILCLLLAILGLLNLLPLSQTVVFGLIAGLAIARLL